MLDGGETFPGSEPATLAALADSNGFGHVTVQWDYAPQRPLALRLRDELHDRGLTFGVWEAEPQPGSGARAVEESGADHYVAQAETPRDWPAIVADFRSRYPNLPAAVVTTFGGIGAVAPGTYDAAIAKPVVDAGFRCLAESYQNADPNATPDNQCWTATDKLGWPAAQPVIGVWGGYPAAAYALGPHPGYWVWLAETLTGIDWDHLKSVNLPF